MTEPSKVVSSSDFDDWFSLNDTVMGGSSKAVCRSSSKGLSLEGVVVEGNLDMDKNLFLAKKVLAKHDENYMPPEISKAINK